MVRVLSRFEPVEQCYDGLNGKVIQWTLAHGNTNHDPSILAFVVGVDGQVFASLMDGKQYQAKAFARWAAEQADAYEKAHPRTRIPFERAVVTVRGEGTERKAECAALEDALAAKKTVLLYFGRDSHAEDDKDGRKEVKRARKFEQGTLDSQAAAKEAEGWVLLRFDLADEAHALLAARSFVTAAPALLLFEPGAEKPHLLDHRTSGQALASRLKRARAAD